ncbi:MAG: rod shape-determining protein MreC [Alphaproteobacteria bacterium PA2]|nr:MAG: rod shape-determining protein MreC [Alphaproteobacteria bacterium PA2]
MALRDNPFSELRLPLLLSAAAALVIALVVGVTMLLSDRRETLQTQAYGVTRRMGDRVVAPVSSWISAPSRWGQAGSGAISQYFFAVSENRRLRAELKAAQSWRTNAIALQDTNDRYRALLGLKVNPPIDMVSGLAVADSRGPFANSRLINVGSEARVEVGNPVMNENGLVGRVVGVAEGVSRVLLLTDVASRTPVLVDRTNSRAILIGDGGPNPRLDYLRGQDPVKENDPILTSGDGGVLPRGIPIGRAVKGLDGRWRVVLAADSGSIDYVRVLLFKDFRQLANTPRLDEPPPPPPPTTPAVAAAPVASPPTAAPASPTTTSSPSLPAALKPAAVVRPTTPKPAAPKPPTVKPAVNPRPAAVAATAAPAADEGDIPH